MKFMLLMAISAFFQSGLVYANVNSEDQAVYKILRPTEWESFQREGYYIGSKDDLRDGFIHLSPLNQVDRIIKKYFSDECEVFVIRFVNLELLQKIKWEASSSGVLYPHLYGICCDLLFQL